MCYITNNLKLLGIITHYKGIGNVDEALANKKTISSKLSFKQELGGKVRVFAIGDYFSQCSLLPIHKWIDNELYCITQDATHDQDKAFKDIIEFALAENIGISSHDLSAATDRIPVMLHREILEKIFGPDVSKLWFSIMSEREFQIDKSDTSISYSVGQPMGFLSSFGMLALWHHMIFRTCNKLYAWDNQLKKSRLKYRVLGDDSVNDSRLDSYYKLIVQELCNIGVNPLKGFSEDTSIPGLNPILEEHKFIFEFAKRIAVSHREVSPIPIKLIKGCTEYSMGLNDLLLEMERRNYIIDPDYPDVLSLAELSFKRKNSIINASFPIWCKPPFKEGFTRNEKWLNSDEFKNSPWYFVYPDELELITIQQLIAMIYEEYESFIFERDKLVYNPETILEHSKYLNFNKPLYDLLLKQMVETFNGVLYSIKEIDIMMTHNGLPEFTNMLLDRIISLRDISSVLLDRSKSSKRAEKGYHVSKVKSDIIRRVLKHEPSDVTDIGQILGLSDRTNQSYYPI
jgi:hypothetical protein